MGSEGRRTVRSPQGEYVCPTCGQPVGTAIKRRKTLGAFVPTWGPGPCRNPACAEAAGSHGEEAGKERADEVVKTAAERPGEEPGAEVGSA